MSEWYQYKINYANNPDKNLTEEIIKKGIAEKIYDNDREVLLLKLKELSSDFDFNITVPFYQDGSLSYVHKWVPDDRIAMIISQNTDEILKMSRSYSGGFDSCVFYVKHGDICTSKGNSVKNSIGNLSSKLITETDNGYKISLPIGKDSHRWGTIFLPKENVTYSVNSLGSKYGISIFFDKDSIPVYFHGEKVVMETADICEKYYKSKNDFKIEINKPIFLELPENYITKKHAPGSSSYYIVEVPCLWEHSSNEKISFCVPAYSVRDTGMGNYLVNIGPRGREHSVHFQNENRRDAISLDNLTIASYFKEALEKYPERYTEDIKNQIHVKDKEDEIYQYPLLEDVNKNNPDREVEEPDMDDLEF